MEPFEKLEITLESMINEKKEEVDRARNGGIPTIGTIYSRARARTNWPSKCHLS